MKKVSPLVLKIDDDGHEFAVLRGAINTLSCWACVVQIEVKCQSRCPVHDFFLNLDHRLICHLGEDSVYVSPLL